MIKNMSLKAYHATDGLSKSMMDKLNRSPAHLKAAMEESEKETEVLLLGSAFHSLVLTPKKFEKEFAVAPINIDRRTAIGKQQWADFMKGNEGKSVLTLEQFNQIQVWADAVNKHPVASSYLKGRGRNEVSIFWTDSTTGELCKARPDRIKDGYIIDLKTAISAHPDDFQRKAYELGYHRQAYWFSEGYENEFGEEPKGFLFIVVEKTAPYNVAVYKADQFFTEAGGVECRKLLNTYKHCKETNNWFGYDGEKPEIKPLELPNYIISKYMEEL